jgi:hypothetical protein
MSFLTYAVCAALGLLFSYMGLLYAVVAGKWAFLINATMLVAVYAWAIFYVIRNAKIGKGTQSAYVLILPMFIVTAMQMVFMIGNYAIKLILPDSEAFSSACKTVGVQFYKAPALPVHSIAYQSKHAPHFTSLNVYWGTRISSLSYFNQPRHPSLEFTETGPNAFGSAYTRHPGAGKEYGIDALTADALVKFNMGPKEELKKALGSQGVVSYELTVIDRRTNEELASLRYVTDAINGRACGLNGEKTISESAFILRAIGLQ